MIDPFDYKEPSCVLCGGKEFYDPKKDQPLGTIPVSRIIEKADAFFNKNDYESAGRLLEYWQNEAVSLKDLKGELSIDSELIGYMRKVGKKEEAYKFCERALLLIEKLGLTEAVSSATIFLNVATAYKAFGDFKNALPIYEKALSIYKANLNENDLKFAGLYNNYALALVDAGEYEKAEKMYLSAIDITSAFIEGKLDSAISYVNLAHMYDQTGKGKDKITDCLFKAYNVLNDESIDRNGYYAFVIEKCAPSFKYFGYEVIAEELKNLSKEIYERN